MHGLDLIATRVGGLSAALVFGYITERLASRRSSATCWAASSSGRNARLNFVADASLAQQLAEIGIVLLMFGVGLQCHVEELRSVRRVAVRGAIAQSVVATLLGALVGRPFGGEWPESVGGCMPDPQSIID